MKNAADVVIIGAGPAGLAAALALGNNALVLERQHDIGGLSQSIEIDGAVFDLGGHSFHTPHEHVRDLVFGAVEMYEQTRDARCFSYGSMIPYPFQKSFRQIDNPEVVAECIAGLEEADGGANSANFDEFILRRFGAGIAKHFMYPYNRKLWARDLRLLVADWVGERVAAPEGIKEKFDVSGGQRRPLQAGTTVAYPARGGFGEIFVALGRRVPNIQFGAHVTRVDPHKRVVYTNDGREYQWQHLISTMPINEFLKRLDYVPAEIEAAVARLDYLSLKLVLVVVGHPVDTEIQRIYSADEHIAAHKTAMNHNSSDYLRQKPHHGIMAEISYSPYKKMYREDTEAWVVDNLLEMGIIRDRSEVLQTRLIDAKYAYPVPTIDRNDIVRQVKDWLQEYNIYTVGRFGEWAYINSDEALHRGMVLGHQLHGIQMPTNA